MDTVHSHVSGVHTRDDIPGRLLQVFAAYVDVGALDACWNWEGKRDGHGYGILQCSIDCVRTNTSPHRVAYILEFGAVPEGMVIDHLCRTRLCCNPQHLEVVTNAENIRRGSVGHHLRKVTKDEADEIRRRYAAGGVLQRELAVEYGLTQSGVSSIISGRSGWR